MTLKLYNSLSRTKEDFVPLNEAKVGLYTCGFTVYDYAHIGSGRKYVGDDIIRRCLTYLGYKVNHVQNVTDVGHLVSDADEGEDKLEKGAKKFGKTVWEVADYFTQYFYESMDKLNIQRPDVIAKATDHIEEQIESVQKLLDNGLAYETDEALYFDVTKFENYGALLGQKLEDKKVASRDEVHTGENKKHAADFALWFRCVGRFKDHTMRWDSPWGEGFPGWHIECSAMSMKYLGEQFDIHTGGIDHLPVHHPNEIAQSEGATGKSPFVKYWIHHAFLKVDNQKMSKSLGNLYTVEDVEKKGIEPLALRYLFLTTHYRDPINFTWESLKAAQNGLNNLRSQVASARGQTTRNTLSEEKHLKIEEFNASFRRSISDDFNMPQALAVLWEVVKSNIPSEDKYDLAVAFDEVLGLKLAEGKMPETATVVPPEVQKLLDKREELRSQKKFDEADKVRGKIEEMGYEIKDSSDGVIVKYVQKVKKGGDL